MIHPHLRDPNHTIGVLLATIQEESIGDGSQTRFWCKPAGGSIRENPRLAYSGNPGAFRHAIPTV